MFGVNRRARRNLDPTTGKPLNFNVKDANGQSINRPFPEWGVVGLYLINGRSNYNGLQTVFTKRLSHRGQGTLTYTLSRLEDSDPRPLSGLTEAPFQVSATFGDDYGPAVSDQRHWCSMASGTPATGSS